jgi:hypothetical protein
MIEKISDAELAQKFFTRWISCRTKIDNVTPFSSGSTMSQKQWLISLLIMKRHSIHSME